MHPLQSDCDPNDPKQFAAWCWAAGIPDFSPNRPEAIPLIIPQLTGGISEMLWDFGFRHHPEKLTKWIEGSAGLGSIAKISKEPTNTKTEDIFEEFLAAENPELLEAIKSASPEEREKMLTEIEGNLKKLEGIVRQLRVK